MRACSEKRKLRREDGRLKTKNEVRSQRSGQRGSRESPGGEADEAKGGAGQALKGRGVFGQSGVCNGRQNWAGGVVGWLGCRQILAKG
jgi:hypothetical protein